MYQVAKIKERAMYFDSLINQYMFIGVGVGRSRSTRSCAALDCPRILFLLLLLLPQLSVQEEVNTSLTRVLKIS